MESCYECGSPEVEWSTLPGTGVVATYVWLPHAVSGEGAPEGFYNVTVVQLDGTTGDPVRMLTNVVDAYEIDDLEVGQLVELECVSLDDNVGLPCFRRRNAAP